MYKLAWNIVLFCWRCHNKLQTKWLQQAKNTENKENSIFSQLGKVEGPGRFGFIFKSLSPLLADGRLLTTFSYGLCVIGVLISSGTPVILDQIHPQDLTVPQHLFKGPGFRCSHILRDWRLGQHGNLGDHNQLITEISNSKKTSI